MKSSCAWSGTPPCAAFSVRWLGGDPHKGTYLNAQFHRFCRRFGKGGASKAVFALGHTILVIVWHLLQRRTDYQELGAEYFVQRHETDASRQRLIRQLEKLGHRVTLEPAVA